eukprot:5109801-Amphidinium_carterae.2
MFKESATTSRKHCKLKWPISYQCRLLPLLVLLAPLDQVKHKMAPQCAFNAPRQYLETPAKERIKVL